MNLKSIEKEKIFKEIDKLPECLGGYVVFHSTNDRTDELSHIVNKHDIYLLMVDNSVNIPSMIVRLMSDVCPENVYVFDTNLNIRKIDISVCERYTVQ